MEGGTKAKGIRRVEGDPEIDCKIEDSAMTLKACFGKKPNPGRTHECACVRDSGWSSAPRGDTVILRQQPVITLIRFLRRNGKAAAFVCVIATALAPANGADLDAAIRRHRQGKLVVETSPGTEVRVEQTRHEFWFGAALSSQAFSPRVEPELRARYVATFLANFNAAVTENALKWHAMEPARGRVDYTIVDAMLQWTEQHGIPLRGHNVFWGVNARVQPGAAGRGQSVSC